MIHINVHWIKSSYCRNIQIRTKKHFILQGYNRKKEYIATQGPLPDTVGDFWRLIWDYKIPSVVMLTNLMEKMKVKCSQYWPDTGSQQYANVNVTLINTIHQADFTIRHFQIKSVSYLITHTLTVLHTYT